MKYVDVEKLLKTLFLSATCFWVLLNFQVKFNQNEGRFCWINAEEVNQTTSQPTISVEISNCSKLTIETLEQGAKYVQS